MISLYLSRLPNMHQNIIVNINKLGSCGVCLAFSWGGGVCVALFYWPKGEEDGRAASGGALAPEPPRATGVGPESLRFCPFPGGNFERGSFSPSFFPFFWDRTSFIVRSQFGREYELETGIFGFAKPWSRWKLCPISKKVGEKRRKWDVRSHKKSDKWDVQSQKMKETQIRETHDIQQHKSVCEIPATGIFLFVCLFVQSISGDLGYITQRFVTSVGNSTFVWIVSIEEKHPNTKAEGTGAGCQAARSGLNW